MKNTNNTYDPEPTDDESLPPCWFPVRAALDAF